MCDEAANKTLPHQGGHVDSLYTYIYIHIKKKETTLQFLEAAPLEITQRTASTVSTNTISDTIHDVIHRPYLLWSHFRYLTIGITSHSLNVLFVFVLKKKKLVREKTKLVSWASRCNMYIHKSRPQKKKNESKGNEGIKEG